MSEYFEIGDIVIREKDGLKRIISDKFFSFGCYWYRIEGEDWEHGQFVKHYKSKKETKRILLKDKLNKIRNA